MKSRHRQPAFTLIEMIVALAILAILLTAVAAAMHASLTSYRENEDIAAVIQTSRAVLNRITREIRTAKAVDWDYTTLSIIPPDDGSGTTEIQYQDVGGELLYRITKDGVQTTHMLISRSDDVMMSSFDVLQELGKDWQGLDCTKSMTVRLVLFIDEKYFAISATASPRRNQLY